VVAPGGENWQLPAGGGVGWRFEIFVPARRGVGGPHKCLAGATWRRVRVKRRRALWGLMAAAVGLVEGRPASRWREDWFRNWVGVVVAGRLEACGGGWWRGMVGSGGCWLGGAHGWRAGFHQVAAAHGGVLVAAGAGIQARPWTTAQKAINHRHLLETASIGDRFMNSAAMGQWDYLVGPASFVGETEAVASLSAPGWTEAGPTF